MEALLLSCHKRPLGRAWPGRPRLDIARDGMGLDVDGRDKPGQGVCYE
jgi:hypothetical protein